MSTVFVDLVTWAMATLQASPPVAPQIYRNRLRVVPTEVEQSLVVRMDKSSPALTAIAGAPIDWTSNFAVDCYLRADSDEEADEQVAPLMNSVFGRLLQPDPALDALDIYIEPGPIEWDFVATGENLVCATLLFTALQRTAAHNLESPQP